MSSATASAPSFGEFFGVSLGVSFGVSLLGARVGDALGLRQLPLLLLLLDLGRTVSIEPDRLVERSGLIGECVLGSSDVLACPEANTFFIKSTLFVCGFCDRPAESLISNSSLPSVARSTDRFSGLLALLRRLGFREGSWLLTFSGVLVLLRRVGLRVGGTEAVRVGGAPTELAAGKGTVKLEVRDDRGGTVGRGGPVARGAELSNGGFIAEASANSKGPFVALGLIEAVVFGASFAPGGYLTGLEAMFRASS